MEAELSTEDALGGGRLERTLFSLKAKEKSPLTFPGVFSRNIGAKFQKPGDDAVKRGLLIWTTPGRWVWAVLHSSADYLTLYTADPRYGSTHANRIGAIFLEEATVELTESPPSFGIVTKTKHKFAFRGRTLYEIKAWKEAIEKVISATPSVKDFFAEWKKNDKGSKDLINCLPKQAFPEKLAENDELYYSLFDETLQWRGQSWSVGKIIGERLTLFVLLGSIGSILTQKMIAPFLEYHSKFEELDIQIVGVATGLPEKNEVSFPGPIYLNESRRLYDFFNCHYGIKFLLAPQSLQEAIAASKDFTSKADAGDRSQLGGVALVGKEGLVYEWHQEWAGQDPPILEMVRFAVQHLHSSPQDRWALEEEEEKTWDNIVDPTFSSSTPGAIVQIPESDPNWIFETGRNNIKYATPLPILEESQLEVPVYKLFFFDQDSDLEGFGSPLEDSAYYGEASHTLVSEISEFVAVIEGDEGHPAAGRKAIAFSTAGIKRLVVPRGITSSPIDYLRQALFKNEESFVQAKEIPYDLELQQALIEFEDNEIKVRSQYKFGVLYMKPGQEEDENKIYSNVETSPEYEAFLELLGEKIELATWDKYMGGLQNDRTGKHSIYTNFEGKEIMFHVSTLLPFSEAEEQQLDRKRHLGNDVVIIVFKEPGCKFNPKVLHSNFTQVYIVVEPVVEEGKDLQFKMACVCKKGVPPFSPFLPSPPLFQKNPETSRFILTKLINAERASMRAPSFKLKLARTRQTLLKAIDADVAARLADGTLEVPKEKRSVLTMVPGTSMLKSMSRRINLSTTAIRSKSEKAEPSSPRASSQPALVSPRRSETPPGAPQRYRRVFLRCEQLPLFGEVPFVLDNNIGYRDVLTYAAKVTEKPVEAITLQRNGQTIKDSADLEKVRESEFIDLHITLPTL